MYFATLRHLLHQSQSHDLRPFCAGDSGDSWRWGVFSVFSDFTSLNDVLIRTLLGTWDPTTLAYINTPRCVCRNSHRGESSLANMFISKATKMSNILGT